MRPRIVQICALDSTMFKMLNKLNESSMEKGFEVHCICSGGKYVEILKEQGYKVHPVNIAREIDIKSNLKTIKDIYRTLREIKPDIVHVHTPVAAVLGRIAAKLARVNTIIYTAHGFYFHEGMSSKQYKLFYNIEKYIGKFFTDYIFTQSKEDFLLAKKGKFLKKNKNNNYLHISNGIDLQNRFNINSFKKDTREQVLNEYGLANNTLVISFIGRMVKEKGIVDLVNVMKKLDDYEAIHLFAIGGIPDSERDKSMSEYIIALKDLSNITFTGAVEDVERYLYSSDIFVLPSYREGMPRSIIEAMSMRNAIIATNIRGSREEVVPDYNGYLVNTNASEEIKTTILELYKDNKKLKNFQANSLKRARNLYDEEKVVDKQIKIFKEVVS